MGAANAQPTLTKRTSMTYPFADLETTADTYPTCLAQYQDISLSTTTTIAPNGLHWVSFRVTVGSVSRSFDQYPLALAYYNRLIQNEIDLL